MYVCIIPSFFLEINPPKSRRGSFSKALMAALYVTTFWPKTAPKCWKRFRAWPHSSETSKPWGFWCWKSKMERTWNKHFQDLNFLWRFGIHNFLTCEWVSEWVNQWMNACMHACMHVCMYACNMWLKTSARLSQLRHPSRRKRCLHPRWQCLAPWQSWDVRKDLGKTAEFLQVREFLQARVMEISCKPSSCG